MSKKHPWSDDDIASIRAVATPQKDLIRNRVELPESPHGSLPSGHSDFRGFPASIIASVKIESADFSQCRSPDNEFGVDEGINLTNVHCTDVRFDRSRVFHRIGGTFRRCSFLRIGTDRCIVTGTFEECDFTGTSFRNAHLSANFIRCHFENCNLNLASWGSSFEACSFEGSKINKLFSDVRDFTLSSQYVTFCMVSGKLKPNETRHV